MILSYLNSNRIESYHIEIEIILCRIVLNCVVLYCTVLGFLSLSLSSSHSFKFHLFFLFLFQSFSSLLSLLCIQSFTTEEEAVQIANDSTYGLAAAVFSSNPALCDRVVRKMRAGVVWQNCSQVL